MPRDRAACNRAIAAAWARERQLVLEGRGTRNWTEDQQIEIIDKGKAFDDNGIAFDGQHMKSAAAYPDYQGDPNNIQFLTKTEHLAVHNGNYQNPTNWYYDPDTQEKTDFGDNPPIPCTVISLHPWLLDENITGSAMNQNNDTEKKEKLKSAANPAPVEIHEPVKHVAYKKTYVHKKKSFLENAWDETKRIGGQAVKFVVKHKKEILIGAGIAAGAAAVGKIGYDIHKNNSIKNQSSINHISEEILRNQSVVNNQTVQNAVGDLGKKLGEGALQSGTVKAVIQNHAYNPGIIPRESLRDCSALLMKGYRSCLSEETRRKILDETIRENGEQSVTQLLNFLISTRSANKKGLFDDAVSIWKDDLSYIIGKGLK